MGTAYHNVYVILALTHQLLGERSEPTYIHSRLNAEFFHII